MALVLNVESWRDVKWISPLFGRAVFVVRLVSCSRRIDDLKASHCVFSAWCLICISLHVAQASPYFLFVQRAAPGKPNTCSPGGLYTQYRSHSRNTLTVALDLNICSRMKGFLATFSLLFRSLTEASRRSFARSRWILRLHHWRFSSTSSSEPSTSTGERLSVCKPISLSLSLSLCVFTGPQLGDYLLSQHLFVYFKHTFFSLLTVCVVVFFHTGSGILGSVTCLGTGVALKCISLCFLTGI